MPGPPSVIEAPLNVGFIGKAEQLGHPSHKPMVVYEQIVRMVTKPGDLVFDPMCGSGTTGTVCRVLGRGAILSDIESSYVEMTRLRLKTKDLDEHLIKTLAIINKQRKRAHPND